MMFKAEAVTGEKSYIAVQLSGLGNANHIIRLVDLLPEIEDRKGNIGFSVNSDGRKIVFSANFSNIDEAQDFSKKACAAVGPGMTEADKVTLGRACGAYIDSTVPATLLARA